MLGVLPLVFATGASSEGRHSVGTTVFGGMFVSTFLNLFILPILYVFGAHRAALQAGQARRHAATRGLAADFVFEILINLRRNHSRYARDSHRIRRRVGYFVPFDDGSPEFIKFPPHRTIYWGDSGSAGSYLHQH